MNPSKCIDHDYINFLVAAQRVFSTVEASRSHPSGEEAPAHDAYTRLLQRLPPDSEALWSEVKGCIDESKGLLIIDDTTLDKSYASKMALVTRNWSSKHHAVVQGINLISLVWSNGDACISIKLMSWAQDHDILLDFIQPGKPAQNAYIERFNRAYREQVLDFYLFQSLKEVHEITQQWISSYNQERPHDALNGMTPTAYRLTASQFSTFAWTYLGDVYI